MKKLLPFLFISLALSFTVKIVTNTDGIMAYYGFSNQIVLKSGENLIDIDRPTLFKFSAFYGKGWVAPKEVMVDSTSTVYVMASLKTVKVSFDTDPRGAKIYIVIGDGKFQIGETPFDGDVPSGRWKFRFEREGYYPFEKVLDLKGGERYAFKLKPKNLYTFVTTPPASVLIDGKFLGDTPTSTILKNGTHTVEFTLEGILAKRLKVSVGKSSKPTTIELKLPKVVRVKIETNPSPVYVSFDGKIFRSPVVLKVLEGKHHVECWADGYKVKKKDLDILGSKTVDCDLKRKLYTVNFTDDGTLTLDGNILGWGKSFQVPGGVHFMEFERDGERVFAWMKYVNSNELISVGDDIGTVIVLEDSFMINGKKYVGPAVISLKSGRYVLYFKESYVPFSVRGGKITVLPYGGALVVLSDPPGMKILIKKDEALEEIVAPKILKVQGDVVVAPLEGCKIGKGMSVSVKSGEYSVVLVDSKCGVRRR